MTYSKQLLLDLIRHTNWSKYRVAKELGVTAQYIGRIDKSEKKNQFSNEVALKIADILEIDGTEVLCKLEADKATTKREKEIWVKLALSSAATVLMTLTTVKAHITDCVQCIFIKKMIDRSLVNMR